MSVKMFLFLYFEPVVKLISLMLKNIKITVFMVYRCATQNFLPVRKLLIQSHQERDDITQRTVYN